MRSRTLFNQEIYNTAWSTKDKELMLELYKRGYSYAEIGVKLGRTAHAVNGQMNRYVKGYKRHTDYRV